MTQRQAFFILALHAIVALFVLICATTLGALGDLDPASVTAIFGTAIGLVGGTSATLGLATINGGTKGDMTRLGMAQIAAGATPTVPGANEPPLNPPSAAPPVDAVEPGAAG